jgi:hypothetical protein
MHTPLVVTILVGVMISHATSGVDVISHTTNNHVNSGMHAIQHTTS